MREGGRWAREAPCQPGAFLHHIPNPGKFPLDLSEAVRETDVCPPTRKYSHLQLPDHREVTSIP